MIKQQAFQTAGLTNISTLYYAYVLTENTKYSTSGNLSYNSVNDLTVPVTLRPASVTTGMAVNPGTVSYSNATKPKNTLTALSTYNRLSQTFSGVVRPIGHTALTGHIGQLININPADTAPQGLLRLVLRSNGTANSTIRVYICNSATVYKQIDITLPALNTEYIIDDISWLTNGTYGVVNVPVTIDGTLKGTTTAVVTSVGVLPLGGTYQSIVFTGTLGASALAYQFYNNELQKYGAKQVIGFCCFKDPIAKFTKEIQDILCRDSIVGSYTKSKTGEVTITAQKWSGATEALLNGADIYEETGVALEKTVKVKTQLIGANIQAGITNLNPESIAIDCVSLVRTTDNLTTAQLLPYNYSVNTTLNAVTFASDVTAATEIEVTNTAVKSMQSHDPFQLINDKEGILYWNEVSSDKSTAIQHSYSTTSVNIEKNLEETGNTASLTFKLNATENLNKVSTYKL